MTAKFEYTDIDGRIKEAEAFILPDYSNPSPIYRPVMTGANGKVDPSIIPTGAGQVPVFNERELVQITPQQILAKKIILSKVPIYNSIQFIPEGALPQRNSVDFSYRESDNSITWANLGLDGVLEENEWIEITYETV